MLKVRENWSVQSAVASRMEDEEVLTYPASFDGQDGYDATLTWWRSRVRAPVEVLFFFFLLDPSSIKAKESNHEHP